jgi:DNA-binding CsgD family transcriptional regulator
MTRVRQLRQPSTHGIEGRTIDLVVAAPRPSIDLTKTLERVGVPSAIADQRGTITWLNAAARDAFGDLRGRPFVSVVAPEHVAVADCEVDVLTVAGRRRAQISSVPIEGGDACHALFGVAVTRPTRRAAASAHLTPRQSEVLRLLGQGGSTDDIAGALHLSRETVRNHVRHILRSLGAHSGLEAVALAHRQGLLEDME